MPLFENNTQIISAFVVWLIGFLFIDIVKNQKGINLKVVYGLYIWHTLFAFLYMFYAAHHNADASTYYMIAKEGTCDFDRFGTPFVKVLTELLVDKFSLSWLGVFMVYNIFGFLGLLFFYMSLNSITMNKSLFVKRLVLIVLFLPSINFWTVAVGKDAIAFTAATMALWAILDLNKRLILMISAIIIMLFVRPHIAGVMLFALGIAILFDKNFSLFYKSKLIFIGILIFFLSFQYFFNLIVPSSISKVSKISEVIQKRQEYNLQGSGAIDISSMSFPEQLFAYLYRPMPFEINSLYGFAAGIDNLFLLFLTLLFLFSFIKSKSYTTKIQYNHNYIFILIYVLITCSILAMTTANLGISLRQKWMVMPFLIFIFFLYIDNKKQTI